MMSTLIMVLNSLFSQATGLSLLPYSNKVHPNMPVPILAHKNMDSKDEGRVWLLISLWNNTHNAQE